MPGCSRAAFMRGFGMTVHDLKYRQQNPLRLQFREHSANTSAVASSQLQATAHQTGRHVESSDLTGIQPVSTDATLPLDLAECQRLARAIERADEEGRRLPWLVVIYDGVCNLCNKSVRFIAARDPVRPHSVSKLLLRNGLMQVDAGRENSLLRPAIQGRVATTRRKWIDTS